MASNDYKKPPIIEAVIDIGFKTPLNDNLINDYSKKLNKHYPDIRNLSDINVSVSVNDIQNPSTTTSAENKCRLSTSDQTQMLIISKSNYGFSQLAPYLGWDDFFNRFMRDWKVLKGLSGFREISRIGVRYINRIDLPMMNQEVDYTNFLNIYPHLPESMDNVHAYSMQVMTTINEIGCLSRTNSAIVESPILGHVSFIIDNDLIRNKDLPQRDEDVFDLLSRMRSEKNRIFESYIKQPARELFDNAN